MLPKILLIAGLLFIFYQDVRYRAVYWMLFPLLLALMFFLAVQQQGMADLTMNSGYNLIFLFIQLCILFLYFSVKARGFVNITSGYLGWGDILFLLCIAFYFSPLNYLLFYILSLITVLLITLIMYRFSNSKELKIPLAGLQAILFAIVLIADWGMETINITSDYWLVNYLSQ